MPGLKTLTFNGQQLPAWLWITKEPLDLAAPISWSYTQRQVGARATKRRIDPRELPFEVAILADSEADLFQKAEQLAAMLYSEEAKILTRSSEPGREYLAVWERNAAFNKIQETGEGTLIFTVPGGLKQGPEKIVDIKSVIKTDFKNKVAGSVIENANIVNHNALSNLSTPSTAPNELSQSLYDNLKSLNGIVSAASSPTSGMIAQQRISYNIGEAVKRALQFAVNNAWLKANITRLTSNWHGKGSGPNGNKANLTVWNQDGLVWNGYTLYHTNSSITKITYDIPIQSTPKSYIDTNGIAHFLGYADAASATIASTIETDFAELEIEVNNIIDLQVGGTYRTAPIFEATFTGAATEYKIENGAGKFVRVIRAFAANDKLVIDHEKELITLNGVNIMPALDFSSRFFNLEPGSNKLLVTANNQTTKVKYKEKWQ